MMAAVDDKAIS